MEQIKLYLAKFANIVPQERLVREVVARILSERTGVDVSLNSIKVRGNTVHINASPVVKNILFLYKEDVLRELQEKITQISAKDVR